jgi:hypothetical protein
MSSKELFEEAKRLEEAARAKGQEAMAARAAELRAKPLAERLVYAAFSRCECGAGLAYDPAGEVGGEDGPFHKPNAWDCSSILLGTAVAKGEPGWKTHTSPLPFAFYSVKSENQLSAGGATTRPQS